jgi:2-methylcitrate dehydratase PrpD
VEVTAERVRALLAHRRGSEGATVVGSARRGPVEDAALANGTAAHALDYDDLHQSLSGHPSVPVLPAALALAERQHLSGAALITAFLVGIEIEAKLGRALNPGLYEAGWHATSALGVFGAAAAAAKLLGLSVERIAQALAIAASLASGIKANFGTDCKPLHAGHAARCGVEAALLAEGGFTGNPRALEHGDGFGATYGAGSPPAWDVATAGLGAPHEIVDPGIGVKRFPACASTHQALDATLALAEEHAIDAAAVEAVECAVHYLAPHQLIYDRATTALEGKFSMPYCVSVALLDRSVGFAQFTDERVRRADVQALMPRVRMVVHPEQTTRDCLPTRFSEVTIALRDGRRLQRRVHQAKGQPRNPLTDGELIVKFRDCAARALPVERAESILTAVQQLETLADVSALARLLSADPR